MHERRYIRERIAELLKTGIPVIGSDPQQYMALDVGGRVYVSRPEPLFDTEYPCCLVYFTTDTVTSLSSARDVMYRQLGLNVDVALNRRDDQDNEMDRLAWQVETILLADHTLGLEYVNAIELRSVLPYHQDADGEQIHAVIRNEFAVDYWTERYMPGTLDEFLSFGKEIVAQVGLGAKSEVNQTIRGS